MLQPRKIKHRKWQKGRSRKRTIETRGTEVAFGSHGLKALETRWLSANQLEAAVKEVKRVLGKTGMVWSRVFPHKPVTRKAAEVGMGGGKGDVAFYVFPVHPGRILFEVDGVDEKIATAALKAASYKLPVATKVVSKVS